MRGQQHAITIAPPLYRPKNLTSGCTGADAVERAPQAFAGEAKPDPAGWPERAVFICRDVHSFEPALAELLKSCDHELPDLVACGLEPIARPASAVQAAMPLRHDALGTDGVHVVEQLDSTSHDVIDVDDALAYCVVEHAPQ